MLSNMPIQGSFLQGRGEGTVHSEGITSRAARARPRRMVSRPCALLVSCGGVVRPCAAHAGASSACRDGEEAQGSARLLQLVRISRGERCDARCARGRHARLAT